MRLIFFSLPLLHAEKEDITIKADSNKNKSFTERVIDMVKQVLRLYRSPWQTFRFLYFTIYKKSVGNLFQLLVPRIEALALPSQYERATPIAHADMYSKHSLPDNK